MESGATRNFEPWRAEDEVTNCFYENKYLQLSMPCINSEFVYVYWQENEKEKGKREAEEMGDAMKSLENRTLDSKREMDILAALDEMKSMKVIICFHSHLICY